MQIIFWERRHPPLKNSFVSHPNIVRRNPDLRCFQSYCKSTLTANNHLQVEVLQDVEAVDVDGRPGFEPRASAVIIKPTIYHCPRLMGGVGGTPLLMVIVLQPRSAMPCQWKGISVCGAHLTACTYHL